jgi:hypothetical protein
MAPDKTRQDKTRQDKTIHDKTRQDKTRQDMTKARKENTRQDTLWYKAWDAKAQDERVLPLRGALTPCTGGKE